MASRVKNVKITMAPPGVGWDKAKDSSPRQLDEVVVEYPSKEFKFNPQTYTGKIHTMIVAPWQHFADYSVVTIEFKGGEIVKIEHSKPLNAEEARITLDLYNARLLEGLRKNYPGGYDAVG